MLEISAMRALAMDASAMGELLPSCVIAAPRLFAGDPPTNALNKKQRSLIKLAARLEERVRKTPKGVAAAEPFWNQKKDIALNKKLRPQWGTQLVPQRIRVYLHQKFIDHSGELEYISL